MALLLPYNRNKINTPQAMQKIKESFREVVAGQPGKQHYIYVAIVTVFISIIVALFMIYFKIGSKG
jgi:hypothetical protein